MKPLEKRLRKLELETAAAEAYDDQIIFCVWVKSPSARETEDPQSYPPIDEQIAEQRAVKRKGLIVVHANQENFERYDGRLVPRIVMPAKTIPGHSYTGGD